MIEKMKSFYGALKNTEKGIDGIIEALGREPPVPPIPDHPETKVWYKDGSISSYEIEGTLVQNSIQDKTNTVKIEIGNTVTSIWQYAFSSCSNLTSVTIPNSVTSIGNNAFTECSGLISITIPNSVTNIKEYMFKRCSGLTSITIPDSVTSIENGVFSGCSALSAITIPNSVTSIVDSAFQNCFGLTSLSVNDGNSIYDSRNNCNAIIKTSDNKLIAGCKTTIIPNNVTSIGKSAFEGCSTLTSLIIPNSVTSIEDYVSYNCSGLMEITIPNGVINIGRMVFYNCPATVTFEGKDKATVQEMANYRWSIGTNKIVCTNGTL